MNLRIITVEIRVIMVKSKLQTVSLREPSEAAVFYY